MGQMRAELNLVIVWLTVAVLAFLDLAEGRVFHKGAYIATARKAQFRQARTEWHDLLGRHCPRFEEDALVVLPLHHPGEWQKTDEYKLQLSFDSDRLVTPWLPIIRPAGTDTPVPQLVVTLTAADGELTAVSAIVRPVPREFAATHQRLLDEFADPDVWPKHVLVHYKWVVAKGLDLEAAVAALLWSSLVMFLLMIVAAKLKFGSRADASLYELVSSIDTGLGGEGPGSGGGGANGRGVGGGGVGGRYPLRPQRLVPPKLGSHTD